jgi:hypothetical protein
MNCFQPEKVRFGAKLWLRLDIAKLTFPKRPSGGGAAPRRVKRLGGRTQAREPPVSGGTLHAGDGNPRHLLRRLGGQGARLQLTRHRQAKLRELRQHLAVSRRHAVELDVKFSVSST